MESEKSSVRESKGREPTILSSLLSILKGTVITFSGYAVPLLLLRRLRKPQLINAISLSSFVALYRSLRLAQRHVLPNVSSHTSQASCGAIASLATCAVDPSWASPLLTFWLSVKGVRSLLPDTFPKWAPLAVLSLSSCYCVPTGYRHPDEVHPSYAKFLEHWVTYVGVSTDRWRVPPPGKDLSAGIHPNESLSSFLFTRAFPGCASLGLRYTAPLYALSLASQLIGQRKPFLPTLMTTLEYWGRSAAFLAGYVSSCWAMVLLISRHITKKDITREQCMTFSWALGLWGLVERPSRQKELAAYILSHSLAALYFRGKKERWINPTSQHTTMFALLLACVGVAPLMITTKTDKPSTVWKLIFDTD